MERRSAANPKLQWRSSQVRVSTVFTLVVVWLFALMPAGAAPAADSGAIHLSADDLKALGVNLSEFAPGAISNNETMMVAHQKSNNAKDIAAGHIYKLFFLKFDWAAKKVSATSIWLNITSLEQYAWSPDDKQLLCIGAYGTRFLTVDVATGTVHDLFSLAPKQPGFRANPPLVWLDAAHLNLPGYFYDNEQTTTSENVVAVDFARQGLAAFDKVVDIGTLNHTTLGWSVQVWASNTLAYFGLKEGAAGMAVYAYTGDQKKLKFIDRDSHIDLIAAGGTRVAISFRLPDRSGRLMIHDVATGKAWHVGEPRKVYDYPYMARDGATILVSNLDLPNRKMTTWYAHDTDAWSLHSMPGMVDVFPGVIRFSRKGGMLAFFNNQGLFIRPIP